MILHRFIQILYSITASYPPITTFRIKVPMTGSLSTFARNVNADTITTLMTLRSVLHRIVPIKSTTMINGEVPL